MLSGNVLLEKQLTYETLRHSCTLFRLESTLEFTREKINLEDVLASLMEHLAATTVSTRATEQKMANLIAKSDTLLQSMRMEVRVSLRFGFQVSDIDKIVFSKGCIQGVQIFLVGLC